MKIPAIALRGLCILPTMVVHFDVSRKKSVLALESAMVHDQKIFLAAQKSVRTEDPTQRDLYSFGTVASIKQIIKMPGGLVRVLAEGLERAELNALNVKDGYLEADILISPIEPFAEADEITREAMCRILKELVEQYALANPAFSQETAGSLLETAQLEKLLDEMAAEIPLSLEQREQFLESDSVPERFALLEKMMGSEVEINKVKQELQDKVQERINKNQKEYILREQMKVIKEELGEDSIQADVKLFTGQLETLQAPDEVKEKIDKEIKRYQTMPMGSQEAYVARNYLETLLELPWNKKSEDNEDLLHAQQVLEEDHYGLEKVKERILEYLAVRSLTGKGESPILCLVGPPGTGKTSIARSIARALGRSYVRICLGGVRDEAEIRGHRRTYIGAMPGRIAAGLKQAGTGNPLMLLDEVDKLGSDYKGDPSSALLELLDSAQNNRFRDHFVELPLDLSEVLFLATANDLQTIPKPLLDRMEVIELGSYTDNEKFHIAKEHLIDNQRKKNGLKKGQFTITDAALRKLIRAYTREAGVRGLERRIGQLARKTAKEILDGSISKGKVTEKDLKKYLGRPTNEEEAEAGKPEVGIVRGLAWTSAGGTTLEIEVNLLPGTGKLKLTGQMGDVMKESAEAAISYVRAASGAFHVNMETYQNNDIHIHIPEGAVPKDGPSAGITMATAVMSAVTGKKVRGDLAMTGEITIRGRVLPIGGLKEKILAAKQAGMNTVLVPKANRAAVQELSEEITDGVTVRYVETMDTVLKEAFV